jgi:hypothetical protein
VVVESWFESVIEKVLDREGLGEVRACGFAGTGPVVKVNVSGFDKDLVGLLGRDVVTSSVGAQITWGNGEHRLQKALVNGAELPYRETAKVNGAYDPVRAFVHKHGRKGLTELRVGQLDSGQCRTGDVDLDLVAEQTTVVTGHPPAAVATIYGLPKFANVHPQGAGRVVEVLLTCPAILG